MAEPRIVGVAESELGVTGRSVLDLQAQAITRALADAGLQLRDVDGLATNAVGRFPTTAVAEYLGLRPAWTDSSFTGGSVSVGYVARAAEAVRCGAASVVVVSWASNQRSARSRRLGGTYDPAAPDARLEAAFHPLYPASFYAMAAQRWLHDTDGTVEDLAGVAVAARSWALRNPLAYRYGAGPLTVEQVLTAPRLSTPLGSLDCCLVTDGGGAVVIAAGDRSDRAGVRVLGFGEASTHASMSQVPDLTLTGAAVSGQRAFTAARLTPGDVDVAEVYDSFTITVALTLESLGFCRPGEGARLASSGILALNTSGGGLSYCHPGQFGVLLVVEAVRQLRGEAGERQVPGAGIALCHGTGAILSHHTTLLLGAA